MSKFLKFSTVLVFLMMVSGCNAPVSQIKLSRDYADLRTNYKGNIPDFQIEYLSKIDINNSWWKKSEEAQLVADQMVCMQLKSGGWAKSSFSFDSCNSEKLSKLRSTFDNSATIADTRFLLKYYYNSKKEKYLNSIYKSLNYIFKAQYPSGAWPQFYPLIKRPKYSSYATYNDDVMAGIMDVLTSIVQDSRYSFIDSEYRAMAEKSLEKALEFTLKSQIRHGDKLMGWAQQYDPETYDPLNARPFEPIAMSARETVAIIEILEHLNNKSSELKYSINSAKQWLKESQISGFEWDQKKGILVVEPNSKLWARFYDIESNKPIFGDSDGTVKMSIDQVSKERRLGYEWYGTWGTSVL